jgi:sulfite exporter TauE/SafE
MLYTAFILGLLGSFHCVGMCGPIALALPVNAQQRFQLLQSRLLYNLGRVLTYSLLGLLIGLVGRGLVLFASQQWLSVAIGFGILIAMFLPIAWLNRINFLKPIVKLNSGLKKQFAYFFRQKNALSYLSIGVLNGFLPCGLVYLAMAGALATGSWSDGVIYMALFGLGTLPMMLALSLAGNFIRPQIRGIIYKKFVPAFTFILAILFIIRGLNLGIPYLSPKVYETQQGIEAECCEPDQKVVENKLKP